MKDKRGIGFQYAWQGIIDAIRLERNMKSHLITTGIVIIIGLYVRLELLEWALIILVIGLVLALEMVNTAIENIIDYVKPDIHPHAKLIKDVAAGAVLIASLTAVVVGLLIFIPKL